MLNIFILEENLKDVLKEEKTTSVNGKLKTHSNQFE